MAELYGNVGIVNRQFGNLHSELWECHCGKLGKTRFSFPVHEAPEVAFIALPEINRLKGRLPASDLSEVVTRQVGVKALERETVSIGCVGAEAGPQARRRGCLPGGGARTGIVGESTGALYTRVAPELLRATDLLARIGGDEFAVFVPQAAPGEAERVAAEIVDLIAAQ